jgi:hypothetical protein
MPRVRAGDPPAGDTAMRLDRFVVLASLLAAATHAHAERVPTRYLDLVNATHDSVASLEISPTGDNAFREFELGEPLRGGTTSITLEIPAGDCLRDFRFVFRDGRTLFYPGIDVCRHHKLRLATRDGRSSRALADTQAQPPVDDRGAGQRLP